MTEVRIGTHQGFDRVVFEFAGPGRPGWVTSWTDEPRDGTKGDTVAVEGPETLQVVLTGIKYPEPGDPGNAYSARVVWSGARTVTEVVTLPPFEGRSLAFIGTGERAAYSIKTMTNPTRLIIDLETD